MLFDYCLMKFKSSHKLNSPLGTLKVYTTRLGDPDYDFEHAEIRWVLDFGFWFVRLEQ